MAEETGLGPDPVLAELRERLAWARAPGVGFEEAWGAAVAALLGGLPRLRRQLYACALEGVCWCWRAAYEARLSTRHW